MEKRILGLDLGTTSIGWAYVIEREEGNSEILNLGVRVNPLTTDEIKNFSEGKSITTNADRSAKRHARRNLDRYQLRREDLKSVLLKLGWINNNTKLSEEGKPTHYMMEIRAKAAEEKISVEDMAKVLLMMNKKRGYKSSRKAKNEDESGTLINEMDIAMYLKEKNITPGQYAFEKLKQGTKQLPSFYKSDLESEFNRIWNLHQSTYPEILTSDFNNQILGKAKSTTSKTFYAKYNIDTIKNMSKDKKLQSYEWRAKAATEVCPIDILTYVLAEVNGDLSSSSGYLGAIGDRSKVLKLKNLTVGQLQYQLLQKHPSNNQKNHIYYRQDYIDEFDKIWATQSKFYPEMTSQLKDEIRNNIIFYQRPLKSQKSLISFCELESKSVEKIVNGKMKKVTIGSRVIPRSSPLFQVFKIWSILGNIELKHIPSKLKRQLEDEEKEVLFQYLDINDKITGLQVLKILF